MPSEEVSLADVKIRLSELVDRLEREDLRVFVTRDGQPAAVLLSVKDLESLEETLTILSNPSLVEEIREAERDVAAGRIAPLSHEQARAMITKG